LKNLISGVPFAKEDFVVYVSLLEDGWRRLTLAEAENRRSRFLLDVNGAQVQPLFKEFGNAKCIFDLFGFNWYAEGQEFVYSAPLPF
jgi:hypothetical protein